MNRIDPDWRESPGKKQHAPVQVNFYLTSTAANTGKPGVGESIQDLVLCAFCLRHRFQRLGFGVVARKLFQCCIAAALIVAVGGHWAVLQSVAWVSMAVTYSQTDSWNVALQKTFSGEKPCKLCLAVKEGKQQEQKQSVLKVETKLDFVCLKQLAYIHPALPFTVLSPPSEVALPRPEAPPVPPPRFA
jgi:hypothetical protein